MIMIVGGTGYVGKQFIQELSKGSKEIVNVSRKDVDYYNYKGLIEILSNYKPEFLINCAGYTGKPNVDACELHQDQADKGNVLLPRLLAKACEMTGTPWGHVSSGCIYTGDNGGKGFSEEDDSNFCFDTNNCSYYSGTKVKGEEEINKVGGDFSDTCWRLHGAD